MPGKKKVTKVTVDDLFETLGFSPEESRSLERKADCTAEIIRISRENDYTQKDLSKIFDLSQPRISDLLNAKVSKFSLETLLDYLELLGATPEIHIKVKHPKKISPKVRLEIAKR